MLHVHNFVEVLTQQEEKVRIHHKKNPEHEWIYEKANNSCELILLSHLGLLGLLRLTA